MDREVDDAPGRPFKTTWRSAVPPEGDADAGDDGEDDAVPLDMLTFNLGSRHDQSWMAQPSTDAAFDAVAGLADLDANAGFVLGPTSSAESLSWMPQSVFRLPPATPAPADGDDAPLSVVPWTTSSVASVTADAASTASAVSRAQLLRLTRQNVAYTHLRSRRAAPGAAGPLTPSACVGSETSGAAFQGGGP